MRKRSSHGGGRAPSAVSYQAKSYEVRQGEQVHSSWAKYLGRWADTYLPASPTLSGMGRAAIPSPMWAWLWLLLFQMLQPSHILLVVVVLPHRVSLAHVAQRPSQQHSAPKRATI